MGPPERVRPPTGVMLLEYGLLGSRTEALRLMPAALSRSRSSGGMVVFWMSAGLVVELVMNSTTWA